MVHSVVCTCDEYSSSPVCAGSGDAFIRFAGRSWLSPSSASASTIELGCGDLGAVSHPRADVGPEITPASSSSESATTESELDSDIRSITDVSDDDSSPISTNAGETARQAASGAVLWPRREILVVCNGIALDLD